MRKLLLIIVAATLVKTGTSQQKVITGYIQDSHSEERIPFASVYFQKSGKGKLSDSAGTFTFAFNEWPLDDSLVVTYVGYQDFFRKLNPKGDTLFIVVNLDRGGFQKEIILKSKLSKGLILWRKIVRRKRFNDRYRFDNFSYELYNKLEADFKNFNLEKWKEKKLTKPFAGVLAETVDSTSEDKPFLPFFFTETISDYYYQKSPKRYREVIKASKVSGVKNESITDKLGGMDQNVNVYNNFIPVFDKQFVSPISDNGDAFYTYRVPDTQYVAGRRLIHLVFVPKHKGENTFEGDCWIHDSTFAVQKMNLRLSKDANINFVDKLSVIQEYQFVNDSIWFLAKDKFVVDFSLFQNSKTALTGRKTTTYTNVLINSDSVTNEINKNRKQEEVIVLNDAREKTNTYWKEARHEALNKNEKAIYHLIDTITQLPVFNKYKETVNFLATGYRNIGNFQIGPWFNWISGNSWEGFRLRFDLGTNGHFSKKWYLSGYLAYGFGDQALKGKGEVMYLLNKKPRSYVYANYVNDLDFGQSYYDEISSDNIFRLAIRKPDIPIKFMKVEQQRLEYFKETNYGLSTLLSYTHKQYTPLQNIPPKSLFPVKTGEALNNSEVSIRFRFAYLEKFLENNFFRTSLGSPYPIIELKYSKGLKGLLNSGYEYDKLNASVSDYFKLPPYGSFYFNAYVGRVFGTLPYPLLEVHPGNELYYYNTYAFNLMEKYEYISDKYAGLYIEHNIGNGIFRLAPVIRKLKWRQFWTARSLWGSLSEANKALNDVSNNNFKTLDGKTYLELGTGIDNIIKFFRVDLVWRVLPRPLPPEKVKRFGIFGSFRLQF